MPSNYYMNIIVRTCYLYWKLLEVQSLAAPVATLWIKQCKTNAEGSKIAPMLRTASIPKTLANPCCPEHAKTQTANATQFVFSIS